MKKAVSMLILIVMMISCLPIATFAALPSTSDPMWDNTSYVSGTMVFDGTLGVAEMRVVGKRGVSSIEGNS